MFFINLIHFTGIDIDIKLLIGDDINENGRIRNSKSLLHHKSN